MNGPSGSDAGTTPPDMRKDAAIVGFQRDDPRRSAPLSGPPSLQDANVSSKPKLRSLGDRIRQIALFELGGLVLITPPFAWISGVPLRESIGMLALLALIAAIWNGCYNTGFDWVEGRLTGRTADRRPFRLRCLHALGFETGLLMLTLPVIMWWTGMGWLEALIADIGLAITYTAYALLFNMGYDRIFPIQQPAPGIQVRVPDERIDAALPAER